MHLSWYHLMMELKKKAQKFVTSPPVSADNMESNKPCWIWASTAQRAESHTAFQPFAYSACLNTEKILLHASYILLVCLFKSVKSKRERHRKIWNSFRYLFFLQFNLICKKWQCIFFPSTLSSLQIFHIDSSIFSLILEPHQLKARVLVLSFEFPAMYGYLAFLSLKRWLFYTVYSIFNWTPNWRANLRCMLYAVQAHLLEKRPWHHWKMSCDDSLMTCPTMKKLLKKCMVEKKCQRRLQ